MMKNRLTPRDLVRRAGRMPVLAAAAASLVIAFAFPAWAQQPAKDGKQGPQVKVSDQMTVDLHVKDEDLGSVLELLSIQSQKNIIASKNVSARVTATMYGVTFKQALDALLHVNGFGYIESGNFIYVYTLPELEEIQKALKKRIAKPIRLSYLNAADAALFVKPLVSKDGELHASAKTDNFTIPDKAPVGKDDYALGATLVVIDYEENIAAVEALVAELDTRPAQVLVEATVLQTALSEANAFGVDFTVLGDLNFLDFMNVGGPLAAADALVKGGTGSTAGGGVSPTDSRGGAISSTPGNTAGRSTFKLGIITDDVSVFVKLLDEVSDTIIVSHPKILALNRQPARVLVGRRVGYLNTTSTETSTTQTVEFLDTGTQLYFRPFVAKDNSIRMELKPQVSEAIIREQTSSTGAVVSIPDEVTQEIVTNVIVKDGQTVVLGGLFRESTTLTRRQVPVLGDVPIIGSAFRGHDDEIARSEIIFLITPKLINDVMIADAAMKVNDDLERLRTGARQALLPFSREKMANQLNVEAEHLARDGQYEKALWNIQRSLSLNHVQPDAIRLRDRITRERQVWPSNSVMETSINEELLERAERVKSPAEPQPNYTPWGEVDLPREKADHEEHSFNDSEMNPTPWNNAKEPNSEATTPVTQQAAVTEPQGFEPANTDSAFNTANTTEPAPAPQSNPEPATNPNLSQATPSQDSTQFTAISSTLADIRSKIEAFRSANSGMTPDLGLPGNNGWTALISAGMLIDAPVNPWVDGQHAAEVVIGSGPDTAYHADYGWIYDPRTGEIWAASCNAAGQPLAKPQTDTTATASGPQSSAQPMTRPVGGVSPFFLGGSFSSFVAAINEQASQIVGVDTSK